jgi:hypothetical protein
MVLTDSPSLANITGTHLDLACKHIQQCQVSFDHMLHYAENTDELEKDKMKFCVHKDEMVVGIGRPWKKNKVLQLPPSAYPRIISNLGNIAKEDDKYKIPRMMITFLFHTATDVLQRENIVQMMDNADGFGNIGADLDPTEGFFYDGTEAPLGVKKLSKYLDSMYDHYAVGISNTIAYANPRTGDTVGSVMNGGLRTVMNGDWEVQTGDEVQWYWTFEKDYCFRAKDGSRKSFRTYYGDGTVKNDYFGCSPFVDYGEDNGGTGRAAEALLGDGRNKENNAPHQTPQNKAANARQNFADRQYGMKPQSVQPSDKACHRLCQTARAAGYSDLQAVYVILQ